MWKTSSCLSPVFSPAQNISNPNTYSHYVLKKHFYKIQSFIWDTRPFPLGLPISGEESRGEELEGSRMMLAASSRISSRLSYLGAARTSLWWPLDCYKILNLFFPTELTLSRGATVFGFTAQVPTLPTSQLFTVLHLEKLEWWIKIVYFCFFI